MTQLEELPPPPSRTKWTRRVPHPVLIGHAASRFGRSSTSRRTASRASRTPSGASAASRASKSVATTSSSSRRSCPCALPFRTPAPRSRPSALLPDMSNCIGFWSWPLTTCACAAPQPQDVGASADLPQAQPRPPRARQRCGRPRAGPHPPRPPRGGEEGAVSSAPRAALRPRSAPGREARDPPRARAQPHAFVQILFLRPASASVSPQPRQQGRIV